MPQNPGESTLFVTRLIAGSGITLTPEGGTGVVRIDVGGSNAPTAIVKAARHHVPDHRLKAAASATAVGGTVNVAGAPGGATSGAGGDATLKGGNATNGNSNGGLATIAGGQAHGSGTGGNGLADRAARARPRNGHRHWRRGERHQRHGRHRGPRRWRWRRHRTWRRGRNPGRHRRRRRGRKRRQLGHRGRQRRHWQQRQRRRRQHHRRRPRRHRGQRRGPHQRRQPSRAGRARVAGHGGHPYGCSNPREDHHVEPGWGDQPPAPAGDRDGHRAPVFGRGRCLRLLGDQHRRQHQPPDIDDEHWVDSGRRHDLHGSRRQRWSLPRPQDRGRGLDALPHRMMIVAPT